MFNTETLEFMTFSVCSKEKRPIWEDPLTLQFESIDVFVVS